ncbi:MAG: TIGR00288 family NYN domain-containing protein [Candidatus Diapherotrites archaeon]
MAENVLSRVKKSLFEKKKKEKQEKKRNIAVFVDGPNILRKELQIDLEEVKKVLSNFGNIKIGKVFLNQYASDKLLEAVANQGFEAVIAVGDVDVYMAVDATEAVFNPSINTIAFVTRDSDFLPAVVKAKSHGKDTIVVLAEEASAAALKNTADYVIVLGKRKA